MKRHTLQIVLLSLVLVFGMAAFAGAQRVMTKDFVSIEVTDDGEIIEDGIVFLVYQNGPWELVSVDGVYAAMMEASPYPPSRYIYLEILNDVLYGGPFDAEVTITVMSFDPVRIRLLYDSLTTGERYEPTEEVRITEDQLGEWLTFTFHLPNMQFGQRAASGQADIPIHARDDVELFVRKVEIKVTPL